jgi:[protein-PII] uridylyltransferase
MPPVELHRLTPPQAPEETHREERGLLPPFKGGGLEAARGYLKEGRALVEKRHREGASGLSVGRLNAEVMDRALRGLFAHTAQAQGAPTDLALAALGGYGRRELSPHSDVDLLLLKGPRAKEAKVAPFAKAFHTLLWDLKLVVGWSVRTAAECIRAAEDDHTVRTALLDARFLAGHEATFEDLAERHLRELLSHKADTFIADKSKEIRDRRAKYGDSLFLLEPDVKKGEGGLRDLEGALWIAQARFRAKGLTGLLKHSVLPASEVATLRAARDFLLRVRHHLHYASGRKEDRLTFDLQEEVARFLGYGQTDEGLPVEQFMRHYYLSAKAILKAADQLVARCEEGLAPRRGPFLPDRRLGAFKVFRGRVTLEGEGVFERDLANMVRLFGVADTEGLPLYSYAREKLVEGIPALEAARGQKGVVTALKALLTRPGTRGQFLVAMHELGVLGALLPEFGRVTALHQHDLYHVYTVDVHSLFAVRRLYALRAGDLADEQPQLTREMSELEDPLPLYLGMMFHDAGKGMGGNHSQRGLELMDAVGERLELTPRQREIAGFLVLKHLLMSHTAQRRDLSDPDLIAQFAAEVGDVEKLTCLYLLTYADICSVGPSMWTEWKAQLLKELYDKARAQLEHGSTPGSEEGPLHSKSHARWRQAFGQERADALVKNVPERYFRTMDADGATLHARLLARAGKQELASFLQPRPGGMTRLTLSAKDRPGLLASFTGILSAHRIDILGAQVFSTADGFALDVFDVKGPQDRALDRKRWRTARADLWKVLRGQTTVDEVLRRRRSSPLLAKRLPAVETKVTVDNRASNRFTVLDVRAQDRVGVLYAIASALHGLGIEIVLAKIATEANRAVDSFYVVRQGTKVADAAAVEAMNDGVRSAIETFARELG